MEIHAQSYKRCSRQYRMVAMVILMVCLGILILAALAVPRSQGLGSHTSLGLPACGFLQRTGLPCPTCGMTTAFAYVVRGRLDKAFMAQPAGMLAALLCLCAAGAAGFVVISGRCLDKYTDYIFFKWFKLLIWALVIFLAGWGWAVLQVKIKG